jgi:hypothetical protein
MSSVATSRSAHARRLARFPQQDEQLSIAKPATLVGEIAQTGAQLDIGRPARSVADHFAITHTTVLARRSLIPQTHRDS